MTSFSRESIWRHSFRGCMTCHWPIWPVTFFVPLAASQIWSKSENHQTKQKIFSEFDSVDFVYMRSALYGQSLMHWTLRFSTFWWQKWQKNCAQETIARPSGYLWRHAIAQILCKDAKNRMITTMTAATQWRWPWWQQEGQLKGFSIKKPKSIFFRFGNNVGYILYEILRIIRRIFQTNATVPWTLMCLSLSLLAIWPVPLLMI